MTGLLEIAAGDVRHIMDLTQARLATRSCGCDMSSALFNPPRI